MKVDLTRGRCACGCGRTTGRRFARGHDAILRAALVRALLASEPVVVQRGESVQDQDARGVAALLDAPSVAYHGWAPWAEALDRAERRFRAVAR